MAAELLWLGLGWAVYGRCSNGGLRVHAAGGGKREYSPRTYEI